MISSFKYRLFISLMVLFIGFGCAQKNQPAPVKTEKPPVQEKKTIEPEVYKPTSKTESIKQAYFIHIVKWKGETLSIIARWYLGKYENWKLLAIHNPELNPHNIHVGDRVWVPTENIKTSKQMPKSFLQKYNKKKHIDKELKKTPGKPIELYGPKEQEEETDHEYYD